MIILLIYFSTLKKMSSVSASMFYPSDTDSDDDSNTTLSTLSTKSRKKWKTNVTTERSNKSHTAFFSYR